MGIDSDSSLSEQLIASAHEYRAKAQRRLDHAKAASESERHVGHKISLCVCCVRDQIAAAYAEGVAHGRSLS